MLRMQTASDNSKTYQTLLNEVRDELSVLLGRVDKLRLREQTILHWIAEEGPTQAELLSPPPGSQLPDPIWESGTELSAFIRHVLADRKPHTLDEIRDLAVAKKNLLPRNKSPGRVVHFALTGLAKHGYVERHEDRTYTKGK